MTSDIQAVLDMAASLAEGIMDETQTEAIVPLGSFEDLSNMVYQWRKAGGKTSDEMDVVIPGQVSSRPCQTCWHPEWAHCGYKSACCGQNAADTGGCDCKAFVPRGATT